MAKSVKKVKVSTTLPADLYRRQKLALEQGFGIWKDENHPDLNTPEDSVAYVRRLRENY